MTQLHEIVNPDDIRGYAEQGYLTIREHPEFPALKIANYTDKTAYERVWDDTTRTCRGLIWNDETGEVLARPFPKFFNWDEKEAPRILDGQVVWHWDNKYDGSLGILYLDPTGHPRIATRGSFASEQAALGTKILHSSGMAWVYAEWIPEGYTPLFEICGPDNRIVLRYDENFLAPLGKMHIETGTFMPPEKKESRTMHSLLTDLSRENAEGWVVWLSHTKAVKIKQADYVELHRMVSNLTEKEVWRQLRAGTYREYVKHLPDELYELAEGWARGLQLEFVDRHEQASIYADGARTYSTRKDQAIWIQENVRADIRGLVFGLLDAKDITDSIWRMLEPKGGSNEIQD